MHGHIACHGLKTKCRKKRQQGTVLDAVARREDLASVEYEASGHVV